MSSRTTLPKHTGFLGTCPDAPRKPNKKIRRKVRLPPIVFPEDTLDQVQPHNSPVMEDEEWMNKIAKLYGKDGPERVIPDFGDPQSELGLDLAINHGWTAEVPRKGEPWE